LPTIGNRLSVAAGVALATGMMVAFAPQAEAQVKATGGTITRYRENGINFIAHIFTNSAAAQTFTPSSSLDVDYLIVAGGGGGGGAYDSGGGGAGGVRLGSTNMTAGTPYTITVGAGGLGYGQGTPNDGTNGKPSSISGSDVAVNTTGGGRGGSSIGSDQGRGLNGGSGGGGLSGWGAGTTPGKAVGGGELGNDGGMTVAAASGGGGAGSVGLSASPYTGGSGTNLAFTGVLVEYARGGVGGLRGWNINGASGAANTGNGGNGGGGGPTKTGGNGGSGIVIVRYVDSGTFTASVAVASATAQWPFQVGAFTITRPDDANTNYEAVVSYTMTGTATNGVDYSANWYTNSPYPTPTPTPLSGYATLGVGVTSVVVNVYPLYNPPFSAKTATLTLNVPGNPAANVTFQAWSAGTRFAATATGGTLTTYPYGGGTNWEAYVFTNTTVNGTLTVTSGGQVEYLVVAGGGGGGGSYESGGGGAGGVRFGVVTLPAGTYTMAVGDGGRGATGIVSDASNGGSSRILGSNNGIAVVRALGGGYGGSAQGPTAGFAGDGGSGGGANWPAGGTARPAGKAVGGVGELGYDGGTAPLQEKPSGGGGAGSVGRSVTPYTVGANYGGGSGTNLAFTGVTVEYGRGGDGGLRAGNDGVPGTANTGNGGNGGGGNPVRNGGKGGSGIVVVRYLVPPPPKGTLIMMR
jgi:hypothetical protein